jgi:ATP-dependent Lhr-like helicase
MARTSAPRPRSAPQTAGDLLAPAVREVVRKRGFSELSEAQEQAIPLLLAGENLVLVAPTGTGKTESAMLPVFDRLIDTAGAGFKAVYITPLRSLNRDILGRMEWWCRELGLSVGVRHGDTPQNERRKQALSPPDLLITTPESLQALFMGKRLREHLKNVRHVIVDEIHELADSKRGAQLAVALERLAAYAASRRPSGTRTISAGSSAAAGPSRSSRCRWRAALRSASGLPGRTSPARRGPWGSASMPPAPPSSSSTPA